MTTDRNGGAVAGMDGVSKYRRDADAALRELASFEPPWTPSAAEQQKAKRLMLVSGALQLVAVVAAVGAVAGFFWSASAVATFVVARSGAIEPITIVEGLEFAAPLLFASLVVLLGAIFLNNPVDKYRERIAGGVADQRQVDEVLSGWESLERSVQRQPVLAEKVAAWLATGRPLQAHHLQRLAATARLLDKADAADRAAGRGADHTGDPPAATAVAQS